MVLFRPFLFGTFLAGAICALTAISCKSGSSKQAGGDEGISVDTYGKSAGEDDFEIAGAPTVTSAGNLALEQLALTGLPMAGPQAFLLEEAHPCRITLQKVDRDAFTLVEVGANAICARPSGAAGFYFKISGLQSDALYVATVVATDPGSSGSATATEKTYKIAIPPLNDDCRQGQKQFTMIADALTTKLANLVLELVTQANPATTADANAQKTLRNLLLPDMEHFAAASRQDFPSAARTYSETFTRIYDANFASLGGQYGTTVCQALIGTLIKTGNINENSNLAIQSSAVQSWLAISKIAGALNEDVHDVYSVTNVTGSFDGFFGYLAAVIQAANSGEGNQFNSVIANAPSFQNATVETLSTFADNESKQPPNTWLAMNNTGAPDARRAHSAVWTGTSMIVWGGGSGADTVLSLLNTGATYNPTTNSWTPTNTVGAPAARYCHTGVWVGSKMIVWGGLGDGVSPGMTPLASGGVYDPIGNSWTGVLDGVDTPVARHLHTAISTGSKMIVWGGSVLGGDGLYGTGGIFDPNNGSEGSWTPTDPSPSAPKARSSHSVVWTGSKMIVWGGYVTGLGLEHSGGSYDPSTNLWIPMTTTNAPSARQDHTAVWTGSKMIVWGGNVGSDPTNGGGQFDPDSGSNGTWTPTNEAAAPTASAYHTAVWTGTKMIVWGGYDGSSFINSGGFYDPAIDSWSASLATDAPSARWLHSAFWTGTKMLIWGGAQTWGHGSDFSTGSLYAP